MPRCLLFILLLLTACSPAPPRQTRSGEAGMDPDTPEVIAFKADIPIYPNSELPEKQSNIRTDGEQTRVELVMYTTDSGSVVSTYYKEKLGLDGTSNAGSFELMGRTPKGNFAIITISKEDGKTKIDAVSIESGV